MAKQLSRYLGNKENSALVATLIHDATFDGMRAYAKETSDPSAIMANMIYDVAANPQAGADISTDQAGILNAMHTAFAMYNERYRADTVARALEETGLDNYDVEVSMIDKNLGTLLGQGTPSDARPTFLGDHGVAEFNTKNRLAYELIFKMISSTVRNNLRKYETQMNQPAQQMLN